MALTPEIRAPQAGVIAAIRANSAQEKVFQGGAFGVYNIPTPLLKTITVTINSITEEPSDLLINQAMLQVVVTGPSRNDRIRAWTFTLDGHDFYVLKLGTSKKTLVFDLSTKMWSWWSTEGRFSWRASIGMNWKSSGVIPQDFGSNVIVGDDSSGVLWTLDPEKGVDDGVIEGEQAFTRQAAAQMMTRGKTVLPIFSVYLTANLGQPALTSNEIILDYSDDQGNTFVTADIPQTSIAGDFMQEFEWRSLGQVKAPGRLFRITDRGAFARIDGLNVNEA